MSMNNKTQQFGFVVFFFFLITNATLQTIKALDCDLKRSHNLSLILAVCPVLMKDLKYPVVR